MSLPLRTEASLDALAEHVGRLITIVRIPLDRIAARLYRGGDLPYPVLLLDPSAHPDDQTRVLLDALALVTVGPGAAASARKVRHLRVVS